MNADLLPKWLFQETLFFSNIQWLGIVAIILIGLIAERLTRILVDQLIIKKFGSLDENKLNHLYNKNFNLNFGLVIFSIVVIIGIHLLKLPETASSFFLRAAYISLTIGLVQTLLHIVDIFSVYFTKEAKKTDNQLDDLLVPLIRKTSKIFIICFGLVYIAQSLTVNVTNLVAGLGIGGLAFALAAKDTLSNFFGSLTVILDRPFQIGEYVKIGDNIEGMIEEVGFRSTKIRTFYNSLISVPNNQLANIHIDNFGKREYRRMTTKIGVQYDTPPEKIEAFCEGIRQIILNHKKTRKDYFHVYFNEFAESSLNILVYVFWEVTDWSVELSERHRLLIDILRLGHELKIDFAFPTQTLHLIQENALAKDTNILQDFHKLGAELANKITQNPISMQNPRSGTTTGKFE